MCNAFTTNNIIFEEKIVFNKLDINTDILQYSRRILVPLIISWALQNYRFHTKYLRFTSYAVHIWASVPARSCFSNFARKKNGLKKKAEIIHVVHWTTLQWYFRYFRFYYHFLRNVLTQREESRGRVIPLGCFFITEGNDIQRETKRGKNTQIQYIPLNETYLHLRVNSKIKNMIFETFSKWWL